MSDDPDFLEAKTIGSELIGHLQDRDPSPVPMQAMAAMAIALGSMVASASACGITRPERSGALLKHLFRLAEQAAFDIASAG